MAKRKYRVTFKRWGENSVTEFHQITYAAPIVNPKLIKTAEMIYVGMDALTKHGHLSEYYQPFWDKDKKNMYMVGVLGKGEIYAVVELI